MKIKPAMIEKGRGNIVGFFSDWLRILSAFSSAVKH